MGGCPFVRVAKARHNDNLEYELREKMRSLKIL